MATALATTSTSYSSSAMVVAPVRTVLKSSLLLMHALDALNLPLSQAQHAHVPRTTHTARRQISAHVAPASCFKAMAFAHHVQAAQQTSATPHAAAQV